jgi:hypothetical protein
VPINVPLFGLSIEIASSGESGESKTASDGTNSPTELAALDSLID